MNELEDFEIIAEGLFPDNEFEQQAANRPNIHLLTVPWSELAEELGCSIAFFAPCPFGSFGPQCPARCEPEIRDFPRPNARRIENCMLTVESSC
jgi:hypothetical protein